MKLQYNQFGNELCECNLLYTTFSTTKIPIGRVRIRAQRKKNQHEGRKQTERGRALDGDEEFEVEMLCYVYDFN